MLGILPVDRNVCKQSAGYTNHEELIEFLSHRRVFGFILQTQMIQGRCFCRGFVQLLPIYKIK